MWPIYLGFQIGIIVLTLKRLVMYADNHHQIQLCNPSETVVIIMIYSAIAYLPPIWQVMMLDKIYFTIPFIAGVIMHVVANILVGFTKRNYRIGQVCIVSLGLLSELGYLISQY